MADFTSIFQETKNGFLGPNSYSVHWLKRCKGLKSDGVGHWLGVGALLLEVGIGKSGVAAPGDKSLKGGKINPYRTNVENRVSS